MISGTAEYIIANNEAKGKYQLVDGTSYHVDTPQAVINILETSRRNRLRIVLEYGDTAEGRLWGPDATPNRGHVSRSGGSIQIPILIRTSRSLGGEGIADNCIMRITESRGGKVLYEHPSIAVKSLSLTIAELRNLECHLALGHIGEISTTLLDKVRNLLKPDGIAR